jgi:hypothetical protein
MVLGGDTTPSCSTTCEKLTMQRCVPIAMEKRENAASPAVAIDAPGRSPSSTASCTISLSQAATHSSCRVFAFRRAEDARILSSAMWMISSERK